MIPLFRITIDNYRGEPCRVSEALDLVTAISVLDLLRWNGGYSAKLQPDTKTLRQMYRIKGVGFEVEEEACSGK